MKAMPEPSMITGARQLGSESPIVRWYDAGWAEWAARSELPIISETQDVKNTKRNASRTLIIPHDPNDEPASAA